MTYTGYYQFTSTLKHCTLECTEQPLASTVEFQINNCFPDLKKSIRNYVSNIVHSDLSDNTSIKKELSDGTYSIGEYPCVICPAIIRVTNKNNTKVHIKIKTPGFGYQEGVEYVLYNDGVSTGQTVHLSNLGTSTRDSIVNNLYTTIGTSDVSNYSNTFLYCLCNDKIRLSITMRFEKCRSISTTLDKQVPEKKVMVEDADALDDLNDPNWRVLLCDKRLKKNIQFVGKSSNGHNIYNFEYIDNLYLPRGIFQGVIAQEIINTVPDAVILDNNGYYRVDYSKLDVKFKKIG